MTWPEPRPCPLYTVSLLRQPRRKPVKLELPDCFYPSTQRSRRRWSSRWGPNRSERADETTPPCTGISASSRGTADHDCIMGSAFPRPRTAIGLSLDIFGLNKLIHSQSRSPCSQLLRALVCVAQFSSQMTLLRLRPQRRLCGE